jgi:inorganic pyrophosphatase
MVIVTSGFPYIDIDAYAGIVGYAELLRLQGEAARAVSLAPFNTSINRTTREWPVELDRTYRPAPDDSFTLIDISDHRFFERFVVLERVHEVIDHHAGFQDYWKDRLGAKADIRHIGAVATQVWERWEQAGLLGKMSRSATRLLATAIIENTLNFGAAVTIGQDHTAYQELVSRAELPSNWPERYFRECQQAVVGDLAAAVRQDVKTLNAPDVGEVAVGQLAVWSGADIVDHHGEEMAWLLGKIRPRWAMNLIDIETGVSHFLASDEEVMAWLHKLTGEPLTGRVETARRLWLRKELIKANL